MEKFIKDYIERGFGSMNKNDFEVAILSKLLDDNEYKKKTDFELSLFLNIPVSKVRRLRYEALLLKHKDNSKTFEKELITEFYKDLENANYKKENERLIFVIQNKMVRDYIKNYLESNGRCFESSLTSSSVYVGIDDFIFLLEKIKCDSVDKEEIMKEAKRLSKEHPDFPDSFSDIMKEYLRNLSDNVIGKFNTDAIIKSFNYIKNKFKTQ